MFAPNREQVRQFFFDTWSKYRAGTPLQGLEKIALDVVLLHPEYRAVLEAPDRTADKDYTPETGQTNPFLHLSLHLALEEQISIDQPAGVRAAFDALLRKKGDRHEALHAALECLGEMVWRSQREGKPPDAQRYLECLGKR
jgi:hypothetical protein